jgi:hypothetical protein
MDARAAAQSVGGAQWSEVKAKYAGLFVGRCFSQFQRNTLETTP